MDAQTQEYLLKYPELDAACCALVRLGVEAIERDGHGETGVKLVHKGKDKPIRAREVFDVLYDLNLIH